ncbi:MAG: Fe-S cluster assembly sulfur transfer protein SufU [Thermoplasmata archaeon]|nr:SUF system NifU family Fe-S cluster assembly protein [Thermoplasmata archaeon]
MTYDIYMDFILENYKNPKNYGKIEKPNATSRGLNPLCGDELEIFLIIDKNIIKDIKFTGKGCAISIASASILTEMVKGKDLDYVKNLKENDLLNALGIEISPARIKCALLSYKTLKEAISNIKN